MMKLRFWLALFMAKLSRPLLKITRHNGTNFPGELALKICPQFLKYIGKPKKIITVTGTNGKTTVSNMTCDILELAGYHVLNNRLGSNINSGISTSLLVGCTLFNKPTYDIAVLEVDERSSQRVYPYVKPDYTIITNLFRDSIMRNAHPFYIADFLTNAIPKTTKLILNADDLISSSVAPENDRVYFGMNRLPSDVKECINLINDIRICPKCGGKLEYEYRRYHHIGKAHCTECGFKSPEYTYTAKNVDFDKLTMTVEDSSGSLEYKLLSDSIFNAYNVVTVVALMRELGMSHQEIKSYMDQIKIVESRYKSEKFGDITVVMQMAKDKNALACSRVFDHISQQPVKQEIILMMNCLADEKHWSENTCWLYDCDFEFLTRPGITHVVATGPRAKDYKLRLLLAGFPEENIDCVRSELEAPNYLRYEKDSTICIMYGTDSIGLAGEVREKIASKVQEATK